MGRHLYFAKQLRLFPPFKIGLCLLSFVPLFSRTKRALHGCKNKSWMYRAVGCSCRSAVYHRKRGQYLKFHLCFDRVNGEMIINNRNSSGEWAELLDSTISSLLAVFWARTNSKTRKIRSWRQALLYWRLKAILQLKNCREAKAVLGPLGQSEE